MDTNKIIHIAAHAGKIVLESGGETYRVEDTIQRICQNFGVKDIESFVTPTGIMVSACDEYGHSTSLVKRITSRTVDLEKIHMVNDLSRNIKTRCMTSDDLEEGLIKIDELKRYDKKIVILFSAFSAAFFTLIFGGNLSDFIVSFFIGGIIRIVVIFLNNIKLNDFFINIIGGAIAAFFALVSVHLKLAVHIDTIVIGSIMHLVPGLAITNAIRDTISGDLVSGISRAIEAFLIAIAIAVGTGIVLKFGVYY